jgi:sphinganine-1-phosphate aldolase
MGLRNLVFSALNRLHPAARSAAEKSFRRLPMVESRLTEEYSKMLEKMRAAAKPYAKEFLTYSALPEAGVPREEILREMETLKSREEDRWKNGGASGAVYHGDDAHIEFLNRVYALHSQSNPLHSDLWPSASKFEAEIVSMTANMLGGTPSDEIGGTVTSGGTESILLAMKTYRDWARATKGITWPEVVAPTTAHAAFDKAGEYFGIKIVRVDVAPDFRANIAAMQKAVTPNTIAMAGSAPTFPHGVVDPIPELSALAREFGLGFHTDACLGGFLLPWAERLGNPVPKFDFRSPGVTSISADTHKYGYAAKGTSVVLYRGKELRHFQYFTASEWPGGLYFSPTLAGSRPGGLSAACWAAMVSMGEQGYLDAARRILEAAAEIKNGVSQIPELRILGDPLWVIAFASDHLDIYRVLDEMSNRGWNLNGLHKPPAVHLCVTLRHTRPCVAKRFVEDLKGSVAEVKSHPKAESGMAPVYGLASNVPFRGMVSDLLKRYLDMLYEV